MPLPDLSRYAPVLMHTFGMTVEEIENLTPEAAEVLLTAIVED